MRNANQEVYREYLSPIFAKWQREGRKLLVLAQQVGVHPVVVSQWKTGVRGISEFNLRRLCIEAGIDRRILGDRPYTMREFTHRRKRSA